MNVKNTKKLYNDFPKLYKGHKKSIRESLMPFGFMCEDGWFDLIYNLSKEITKLDPKGEVEAVEVKEKFGCYDNKTEVLTEKGWKLFKDVCFNDKIACLSKNKFLVYDVPTDIIKYNYNGKMYKLKTRGVDLVVTPNHKLYVSREPTINGRYSPPRYKWFPFELQTFEKYYKKNKVFKKDAEWAGVSKKTIIISGHNRTDNYTDKLGRIIERKYEYGDLQFDIIPFLMFLGWYVAEGYSNKGNISICLNYKNQNETKIVIDIINSLKLKYRLYKDNGIIKIYNKILADWLIENCGHLAQNKMVPKFIKELPKNLIEEFLLCLFLGDGHRSKTSFILTTTSKILANDVQELILKCGSTSRLYDARKPKDMKIITNTKINRIIGKHQVYNINWLNNSNLHQTQDHNLAKSSFEGMINYNGPVYCVSVPEKIIYVRRNGKPVWCGNSLRFYINSSSREIFDLIDDAEKKSYKICEACGKLGKLRTKRPWIQTLCDKHNKDMNDPKSKLFKTKEI